MLKSKLATLLKERQKCYNLTSKFVPQEDMEKALDEISDDGIINSYVKCSCCGESFLREGEDLDKIIEISEDVEEFLDLTAPAHKTAH